MENLFVLFMSDRLVGVYTSHRKATQTMIMDTIRNNHKLDDYTFSFGIEFFTYMDIDGNETVWEIQEVTPDNRV